MPYIELKHISKYVLKDVNLKIEDKELLVLVGPNGAGKSTLLNVIAGLTDYTGEVYFDEKKMENVPPHKRGVGYLFQDLALFPHLNVSSNIAYGLKVQGYPEKIITKRVEALIDALHIGGLKKISLGVASCSICPLWIMAILSAISSAPRRSCITKTDVISSLFKRAHNSVLRYFDVWGSSPDRGSSSSNIFWKGAMALAIATLCFSPPLRLRGYLSFNPRTDIVSEFIGMPNILDCDYCRILSTGLVEVVSGDINIILPYEGSSIKKLAIPPHDIYISDTKPPGPALNRYKGIITEILPINSTTRVRVAIGGNNMLTELQKSAFDEMKLNVGSEVYVIIKLRRLRYVEP
jgi:ABC-type Fe3+/spermidine/putrescine transport system ATPase subunit